MPNLLEMMALSRAKKGGGGSTGDSVFKVTITIQNGDVVTYSADKTYDEIETAFKKGMFVYLFDSHSLYPLTFYEPDRDTMSFTSCEDGGTYLYINNYVIKKNTPIARDEKQIAL